MQLHIISEGVNNLGGAGWFRAHLELYQLLMMQLQTFCCPVIAGTQRP